MRVILNLSDDTLNKLAEFAKSQKRSRKNLMELILSNFAETGDGVVFPSKNGETRNLGHQNANNEVLDKETILGKIEELKKAAGSCQDTRMGKMAKAGYLRDIERLEAKLS